MLPTKGYFQDIECPYYESACNRPYCHFRHRKKPQETAEEEPAKEPEVPTYKPTPKSELANIKSHIPISYVPDLAFRPDRTIRPIPKFSFEKPTYKPTPLSILSSANKRDSSLDDDEKESRDDIEAIREIKQNIANVEYNPEVSLQDDINFEDLSAEFDLIDDIIQEPNIKSVNISNSVKENDGTDEQHKKSNTNSKNNHDKNKEKSSKEKAEKREKRSNSTSSSRSHKSKHHKKDTKDKNKEENKDKRDKPSDKKSEKSRDKDRHSGHKSKHKSSREKEKSRNNDRRKSSGKSKDRDKDKHKEKRKDETVTDKRQRTKSSDSKSSDDINNELLESNSLDNYSDIDFEDDEDTLTECYKIFKEYEPPKMANPQLPPPEAADENKEDVNSSKKRIAHISAHASESGSKLHYAKPKIQLSAAQMMANRFKLAKQAQADDEQKNIMNEIKQTVVKRPPPTLLEAARSYKLQKMASKPVDAVNVIDSILNSAKNKPKKIAPVQNVNSIQRAKAKIEEMAKQKAVECLNKTPAQTTKGAKRVAHVPDISLSDIPDVLNADKSKLPINVRTRFLTMIADECVKLYLTKEDAYARALNEEFGCYEKCKVLLTYKNSAMLTVNRLRKELQEREKMGLGPIGEGESSDKDKSSEFRGKTFYENIKRFVLTEEELDLHCYPRESSVPGRAVIKNRRNKAGVALAENQRKCSRCSKIYLVDEDGFILYREECVYHPLKKRTLRGEQTYLCCKSNDDAGCATSNTHVTEMSEEAELEGYQTTMDPEPEDDPRSHAVYALDCEMCYTIKGLELTRVTIVDSDCKTVYESLVKPLNPIIDYNTTFSGITEDQMERTSTSILQVQANILHLCNSKTILIGHSLESDMKALKIIHGTIVDTSVLFPHKMGLPHKRALKVLASEFLKKIIQNNVSGHDSAEDAITCMELVKWKVKEEMKLRGLK